MVVNAAYRISVISVFVDLSQTEAHDARPSTQIVQYIVAFNHLMIVTDIELVY